MYPRNAASPPRIAIGAVVQISDGAVQTSGVSVVVRPEGGSETAGGGTVSYGASSNVVYYAPTQAETNYTAFTVVAYKTGCVPVSVTVVTTESATAGRTYVGTNGDKTGYSLTAGTGLGNQTADITGSLSGSVGSVSGAVASVTGNVGGNVAGSVASVTAAVTVGTNNDKTGYSISGTKTTLDALNDVTAAAVAVAVRDVDNSAPAADSLGAAVNGCATTDQLNLDGSGYPQVNTLFLNGVAVEELTDPIPSDTTHWNGTAVATPATAGVPVVSLQTGDLYHADVCFTRDQTNTRDEWTVTWFKNGARVTAGITSPTLQVVKRADGTDLVAATAMTQIGSTGSYKLDATGASRVTRGEAVLAVVAATIDGGSRTFARLVSRDS